MNTFRRWWVVLMNGWSNRRQRLGTTFVEMFMVLHPSCLSTMVHIITKVITELRQMFTSGAVWSVFLRLTFSSPPEGAVHGTDRRWRGGCLLDCGGWGLNRAVLCVPAEVGSVCQDQNTRASVFLTARLTYPSCTCLPSNAAQTVCEWGSFFSAARPPAHFPPNKHCTGNCRDIWDFWEVPVERRRGIEQGCSLWHLGGEGRAKTQKKGGIQRGRRDLALGGWWGGQHQWDAYTHWQTGTGDPVSFDPVGSTGAWSAC